MPQDKKSKKNGIEKLRMVLDNTSFKDLNPEDEKHLIELKQRLIEKETKKVIFYKSQPTNDEETEADLLKPQVVIHVRKKEKKLVEFPELKSDQKIKDTEEDLIEIKKIEISGPEFVKVKPKKIEKKEELRVESQKENDFIMVEPPEEKTEQKEEKVELLPEWQPVESSEQLIEETNPAKKEVSVKKSKEPVVCSACGSRLEEEDIFCSNCGIKIEIEAEEKTVEVSAEPEQPAEIEVAPEIIDEGEIAKKLESFKDLKSIDEETAVLLYDNGYTSTDMLKIATIKDLTKIKGLKKKKAKEIKKELEEKTEWETISEEINDNDSQVISVKETIYCKSCGSVLEENMSFCPECGKTLTDVKKEEEMAVTPEIQLEEKSEEELSEEPLPEEEGVPEETKIEVFKDMNSINEKTAVLLYDSGYTSFDTLKDVEYENLVKIKGIKRKTAKKIKKELDGKIQESVDLKPIPIGESAEGKLTEDQIKEEAEFEDAKNLISPVELSSKTSEWAPVEEEIELKEKEEEEPQSWESVEDISIKTEPFQEIESIDEETAVLLYDNGFISVDMLKIATIKDLAKIKGLKKKKAKEIKKELEEKTEQKQEETVIEEEPELIEEQDFIISETEEEIKEQEDDSEKQMKIEVFDEMESIDEDTAVLLYNNGFTNLESLKNSDLKDILKIKGIKKRLAKKIVKELEKKFPEEKEIASTDEEQDEEFFSEDESFEETDSEKLDKKIMKHDEKPKEITQELFLEAEEDVPEIKPDEPVEDNIFKEISSIDEKISKLLIDNGIGSIENLNEKTIKDLTKIRGIKRKTAKKIKNDVEEYLNIKNLQKKEKYSIEENPFISEDDFDEADEWESLDKEKTTKTRKREIQGFQHGDFTLFEKEITTKKGNKRVVRFFSKGEPEDVKPIKLPKGYEVIENKKTGVPYLRKKK